MENIGFAEFATIEQEVAEFTTADSTKGCASGTCS